MGFFDFVKNIGRKVASGAKIVYGQGKNLLKKGVSIGSKIVNNPIVNKAVDFATPFLSKNPYGRAALLGFKGIQTGLKFGQNLVDGIDTAEKGVKSIEKIRQGDFVGGVAGIKDAYTGLKQNRTDLKSNIGDMKSTVIDIKSQFS